LQGVESGHVLMVLPEHGGGVEVAAKMKEEAIPVPEMKEEAIPVPEMKEEAIPVPAATLPRDPSPVKTDILETGSTR
jgi:hypothetical protein